MSRRLRFITLVVSGLRKRLKMHIYRLVVSGLALAPALVVGQEHYAPYTFTTLAGAASQGSADGVGAAARFNHPSGIAVDDAGNLYIADTDNHTIRLAYIPATPAITAQPQSQTVTGGTAVQFSVTASGKPAPTYQWSFNGAAINGATNSTLSLTDVQSSQAGSYTVTATNASDSATSKAATLIVNALSTSSSSSGSAGGGAMDAWFVGLVFVAGTVRWVGRRGGSIVQEGMCRRAGFCNRRADDRAAPYAHSQSSWCSAKHFSDCYSLLAFGSSQPRRRPPRCSVKRPST
jgi:hypothetical protein